ncbi:hypothetical protein HanXRQr2_Chr04g0187751 [Helianthus annuus]|uniref:Uncharacterized protein n=1 Tax=Helianthus annuus TaxID=4232 RepID=A0A9K3NTB7_HELAN|nr:hypothetical protein HanXRQr2_Chr04g0187751 [Helianthus annuus]
MPLHGVGSVPSPSRSGVEPPLFPPPPTVVVPNVYTPTLKTLHYKTRQNHTVPSLFASLGFHPYTCFLHRCSSPLYGLLALHNFSLMAAE